MSIRARLVTAAALIVLPCGAAAQGLSIGVKAGVTSGDIPSISSSLDDFGGSTSARIGYAAGGFVMVPLVGGISIQPEVLYTQKGVRFDEGPAETNVRIKLDFVDVPILARYTFGQVIRGYLIAGPSLNFNVSATASAGFLGLSGDDDISDDVESVEVAFVFGGGIELGPVLLEARLSEGLTDLAKGEADGPIKSRTFLILAGLRF